MDCFYSYWVTRHEDGFGEQGSAALRDLVPVLGLAVKSAAQVDIAHARSRLSLAATLRTGAARPHRAASRSASTRSCGFPTRGSTAIGAEYRARRDHSVPQ